MDIPATQVYEDDFNSAQSLCDSLQFNANKEQVQIGVLSIGANTYPIKRGINKIGRHPECNIVLNNQTVSKNHAEIEADNGESSTWLCDLHSSNKTKLNNTTLRPGRCYELKSGSAIEFGMIHAVYKIYEPLDESLIPETPAPSRQKQQKTIIPGTPDTSLNNSSASENVSMIPATQTADDEGFLFRRPSLPQRNSSSSRRSFVQDSSMEDDSMNESRRSSCRKENVGEPTVSIHNMETQKSFGLQNETDVDIHDVETQKCSFNNIKATRNALPDQRVHIHDLETQHDEDIEIAGRASDLHDVETQHDEDVKVNARLSDLHDVETQHGEDVEMRTRVNDVHDVETQRGEDVEVRNRVSNVHDLETQHDEDVKVGTRVSDVHDVETQHGEHDVEVRTGVSNVHDLETQHDEDVGVGTRGNDVHDVETQLQDVDIHDMKMPRKIGVRNLSSREFDTIQNNQEYKSEEIDLARKNEDSPCDMETQKNKEKKNKPSSSKVDSNKEASNNVTRFASDKNDPEEAENAQKSSQEYLQLSFATNFADVSSELDQSTNSNGSQDLLENYVPDDNPSDETKSKSTPIKDSRQSNETIENSTDEENIFDAATQAKDESGNIYDAVAERSNVPLRSPSVDDDSDDTDQEAVFQRYSRISSQDSTQPSKSQSTAGDDSNTDEEGQFSAIALKRKRASEAKNGDGINRDSDDMFDAPPQRGPLNNKESLTKEAQVSKNTVDFGMPSQLIYTEEHEINIATKEKVDNKDTDDSETDEEGQFSEIALKQKRVSSSFEVPQNESTGGRNSDGGSRNSDNLFDAPTQRVDLKNKKLSAKEAEGSKVSADSAMPTQIIDTEKIEINIRVEENADTKDDDSETDDEGKFTEIALKQKRASTSFDALQNENTEVEDSNGENRDSDNLFEVPTQRGDLENKESLTTEAEVSESAVDFDMSTQLIDTEELEINVRTEKNANMKDDDSDTDEEGQFSELALKQRRVSPLEIKDNASTTVAAKNGDGKNRDSDSIFDVPTQRVDLKDKKSSVKETESSKSSVDFDMSTQIINTEELEISIRAEEKADNKDADDSETDEEGQFSEIALKQKRVSSSFEVPQNESTEGRNSDGESRNSDNLFDAPTQRVDLKNKKLSAKEAEVSKPSVDFDMPTQLIDTEELEINVITEENANLKDDDSDTDEEGQFSEIALKQKRASSSSEVPQNESTEGRNSDGESRSSDNLFDAPTQRVDLKNKKSSAKAAEVSTTAVDFDMPTQIINTEELEINVRAEENAEMEDADDLPATQIMPISESCRKVNEPTANLITRDKVVDEIEDITEMEDNTDTQILSVPEKNPDPNDNGSNKASSLEEWSVEDIDYEMAPTQLVAEVREKPVLANEGGKKESEKSRKVNLDDTVERNLNAMFEDVNDECLEEQPQISTQTLTNMLQSSQCDEKTADNSNEDSQSPDIGRVRKPGRRRKNKSQVASVSSLATDKKPRKSTLESRKRNIIADSPEPGCSKENMSDDKKEEEIKVTSETVDTMIDKNNTVSDVSLRFTPTTSTPKQPRKHKIGELQASELTLTKIKLCDIDEEVPEEPPEKIPQQKPVTPVQLSTILQNDEEEDFMACFPAVRISGTLSNPGSPTSSKSSDSGPKTKRGRPKKGSKKAASKKKESLRKSSKKAATDRTAEDTESSNTIVKPDSSVTVKNFSDVDADKPLLPPQSDEEEVNKTSKRVTKKTFSRNSQKPTTSKHVALQNSVSPVDLENQTSRSPSIQSRTGNSSKENVDRSSVFQVENEAPVVNTEPVKRATLNASGARKRSLSTSRQENEGNDAKKRKEDTEKHAPLFIRGRTKLAKKVNRCSSANILDYITRSSPVNFGASNKKLSLSQPTNLLCSKELMVKVTRMSSPTVLLPSSPLPESKTESIVLPGIRKARRTSVSSHSSVNSIASRENENVAVNKTRRNVSKRASRRIKEAEDVNSQGGEESQEVEMFMCADSQGSSSSVGSRENEKVAVNGTGRNPSQRASRRKKEAEDGSSYRRKESREVEMLTCVDNQSSSSGGSRVNEKLPEKETRRNMNQRAGRRKKETEDINSEMGEESSEVEMFVCVDSQSSSSSVGSRENEKVVVNETQRKASQRISRRKKKAEDITDQVVEESQEVEMIMKEEILKVQTTVLQTANNKNTNHNAKSSRTRNTATTSSSAENTKAKSTATANSSTESTKAKNTRKRANANHCTDTESTASSDTCESDNTHFEVPASKTKQTTASKNTSNAADSTVNEATTARTKRTIRPPSRYIHNTQQSITDSSSEESKEVNAAQTSVNTGSQASTKQRGRKRKAEKEPDKTESKDFAIEDSSSGMNSSIDNASVISTPKMRRTESSFSVSTPLKIKHKILFTGIASNDYNKLLTKLGASQVEEPTKCTVLVTDKVRRTIKFLCALAQSVPIVSVDWLIDSKKAGRFVELENYILKDPAAEAKFGFKLGESLEIAKSQKLLEGYTVVLTPNVAPPPLPELKTIISSCGGKPLVRPSPSWPQKAVIISCETDLAIAKKFLAKAPKTVTIQSTEFLLTGILRQELNFVEHKLA